MVEPAFSSTRTRSIDALWDFCPSTRSSVRRSNVSEPSARVDVRLRLRVRIHADEDEDVPQLCTGGDFIVFGASRTSKAPT